MNDINIIKFDILGLKTMQSVGECRKLADIKGFDVNNVDDQELLRAFREGNTCGIFQFEKRRGQQSASLMKSNAIVSKTLLQRVQ